MAYLNNVFRVIRKKWVIIFDKIAIRLRQKSVMVVFEEAFNMCCPFFLGIGGLLLFCYHSNRTATTTLTFEAGRLISSISLVHTYSYFVR